MGSLYRLASANARTPDTYLCLMSANARTPDASQLRDATPRTRESQYAPKRQSTQEETVKKLIVLLALAGLGFLVAQRVRGNEI